MIGALVEGQFAYHLALGMFAAINPCGFVMLPAYLMYFLGFEGTKPGTQRASIARALVVSVSTSAGFIAVFLVIGTIARLFTSSLIDKSKYVSLLIGIGMIVLGCFMLAGWRPKFTLPEVGGGRERSNTIASMFGFGVAYAVASLGCTIPLLVGTVFSQFGARGYVSGVVSTTLYGVGMGLMITALTVTLAFASNGLLRVLRGALKYMDIVASVFLIATGMYLTWYWYASISDRGSDGLTTRTEQWQNSLQNWLTEIGWLRLAAILAVPVAAAIIYLTVTRRRPTVERTDAARVPTKTPAGSDA